MKLTLAAALTVASLAPASAVAGTLTLTGFDSTRSGNVSYRVSGVNYTERVGALLANYNGTSVSPVFCVDWYTSIGFSTYSSVPTAALTAREGRVAWLYVNLISAVTTAVQGEAFQLAIWDIIHDGGDGLSAGSIRSNSSTPTAVRNAWSSYLTASVGHSILTGNYFYSSTAADGTPQQRLVGQPWPTEVPEPSSCAMFAAGAGLLAVARRRKTPATN